MAEDKTKDITADVVKDDSSDDDDAKTDTYTKEAYNAVVAESIKRKKKNEKLEADLKAIEDLKLTEAEKDKKKIKELEDALALERGSAKARDIDNMILTAASGKNFNDMDIVKMLAKKELESEEEVTKETVDKILNNIEKSKPYLIASGTTNPSSGNFAKTDKDPAKDADKLMSEFLHGK